MDAAAIIAALGQEPHPEGGRFAEVFREQPADGGRGADKILVDGTQVGHAPAGIIAEEREKEDTVAGDTRRQPARNLLGFISFFYVA